MTVNLSSKSQERDEYLDFPNMSFFDEEPNSILKKLTIKRSKDLHQEYLTINSAQEAIDLYEKILVHLIWPRETKPWLLWRRQYFDDTSNLDLEQGKLVREYDNIIQLMEDILDDLAEKFDLWAWEKKEQYLQRKKEILEWKLRASEETIISQIPNFPVLSQNQLPTKRWVSFSIWNILSLWTNWEKIEKQVISFSNELTKEVNNISEDIATNWEFLGKRIREIFDELKSKYPFPRWFDIRISEKEEIQGEKTLKKSERRVINRYPSWKVGVHFSIELPEDIPLWISRSFDITYPLVVPHWFPKNGIYQMHFWDNKREDEHQLDSISQQLPFIIQLSQKSKQMRNITKVCQNIEEDPILDFLYYQIKYNSSEYRLDHLDTNAEKIELIWKNRKELKQSVEWIGFDNFKEIFHWKNILEYNDLLNLLRENRVKYLPIPHKSKPKWLIKYKYKQWDNVMKYANTDVWWDPMNTYFYIEGYDYWEESAWDQEITDNKKKEKILKGFYKENRLTDFKTLSSDLEYYFKTQKSDWYSVPSNTREVKYLYQFDIHLKNDNWLYDQIRVVESNWRLKITIFKDWELLQDTYAQEQAQAIVYEAVQSVVWKRWKIWTKK